MTGLLSSRSDAITSCRGCFQLRFLPGSCSGPVAALIVQALRETAGSGSGTAMTLLLKEIRHNPVLWLLAFVPVVFAAQKLKPEAHTLLFVLSVLAIVPLADAAQSRHRIGGGQDGRRGRRPAQRHAGKPDRTGHRARPPCAPGNTCW